MKFLRDTHALIATHLGLLVLTILIGITLVHLQERAAREELETKINQHTSVMLELAEVTDRNGADTDIANVITDCSRRAEYEASLIQLGKLTKKDLITVQNLHESCGSFYAQMKALMVQKLEREYTYYTELVTLHSFLTSDTESFDVTLWKGLIQAEQARGTLLRDLSKLQEQIINELIAGRSPQGAEIQKLVEEAQQMNELLSVHDREADTLRKQISGTDL